MKYRITHADALRTYEESIPPLTQHCAPAAPKETTARKSAFGTN